MQKLTNYYPSWQHVSRYYSVDTMSVAKVQLANRRFDLFGEASVC